MRIQNWLNRPYPLLESWRLKLWMILGFGAFTYLFLLTYQPFRATEIPNHQALFLAGFGAMVMLGLACNYFLLPKIFPSLFVAERWQVKREIAYLAWSFLLIALLNFSYNFIVGHDFAPQFNFLEFFGISFSIGIFPLTAMIFLVEIYLNRRNQETAKSINAYMKPELNPISIEMIRLEPETIRAEAVELPLDDFLFARSDNNYSTIFFRSGDMVKRQLLRLSLKKMESQLAAHPAIVRCHRSYIVNRNNVVKVSGNARSLLLHLEGFEDTVPVSRSLSREQFLPE